MIRCRDPCDAASCLFCRDQRRRRSSTGLFAPVEQAWHIADLEVEGYGARIEQLLRADRPHFQDFKGEEIAAQRRYIELDLEAGCRVRSRVRRTSRVCACDGRHMHTAPRRKASTAEVTLERIAGMMAQHDASHASEIVQLLRENSGREPFARLIEDSTTAKF